MGYITGTLAGSANPGADIYALIAAELTAEGFELVDTVVIGTRTHKVWKSPAAGNSANKDWFLDVCYFTAGAGGMYFVAYESFNPTTDLAFRGPTGGVNNSGIDATTFSPFGATGYSLEHANWGNSVYWNTPTNGYVFDTSTTTFGYWIHVSPDRIAALGSVNPTLINYAGLYEPYSWHAAAAGDDAFPLVSARIGSSGTASGSSSGSAANMGITRLPKVTSIPFAWYSYNKLAPAAAQNRAPQLPTATTALMGGYSTIPIEIYVDTAAVAGRLGTLIGVEACAADSSVSRGDTVSVDGDTWVLASQQSNSAILMNVSL